MKKIIFKNIFFFLALLIFPLSSYSYTTLKTSHFYIHAPKDVEEKTLIEMGEWAEGAYKTLREIFPYDVAPVHIHVHHQMDLANGSASNIVLNKINVFLHSPGPQEEFSFQNWFQSLIIHELTHVFELDASRGYAKILRFLFGKPPVPFTTPNTTAPFWFHEGMAVFNETLLTSDGRLNSPFYQSIFRATALSNAFPNISRLNFYDLNPQYPYGSSVYVFGSGFFNYLYQMANQDFKITGELSYRQGGRFFYFINYGAEEYFEEKLSQDQLPKDLAYSVLYQKWVKEEIAFQKEQVALLAKTPFSTTHTLFEDNNKLIEAMALINSTNLLYIAHHTQAPSGLFLYNTETEKHTRILKEPLLEPRIVLNLLKTKAYITVYQQKNNQLFAFPGMVHLKNEKTEIWDNLPRVKEIAPSENEKIFVGVKLLNNGKKNLVVFLEKGNNLEVLIEDFKGGSPFFKGNEQIIFVSSKDNSSSLIEYNLSTKTQTTLLTLKGKIRTPYLEKDKIYFSSDSTGVENIYVLEKDKALAITHLNTGGFSPVKDDSGLYFLSLTAHGYVPVIIKENSLQAYPTLPSLNPQRLETKPYDKEPITPHFKDYSIFSYLTPSWWLPSFYFSNSRFYAGAMTSWHDPLEEHFVFLSAHYDFKHKDFIYELYYQYLSLSGFLVSLNSQKSLSVFGNAPLYPSGTGDYFQTQYDNQFYFGYMLQTLNINLALLGGGFFKRLEAKDRDLFYYYEIFQGNLYGPSAKLVFSSKDYYLKAFRPENGFSFSLAYNYFIKPQMHELYAHVDLSFKLFWNTAIIAKQSAFALFGEKIPQLYRNFGGPSLTETDPSLRGFKLEDLQGFYLYLGTLEFHIPLFYFFNGLNTKPIFLRGMYLNLFYDYAQGKNTGFKDMEFDGFLVSMGAELGLSTQLFHLVPLDFAGGYAFIQNDKEHKFYFSVKVPLDDLWAMFKSKKTRNF